MLGGAETAVLEAESAEASGIRDMDVSISEERCEEVRGVSSFLLGGGVDPFHGNILS